MLGIIRQVYIGEDEDHLGVIQMNISKGLTEPGSRGGRNLKLI